MIVAEIHASLDSVWNPINVLTEGMPDSLVRSGVIAVAVIVIVIAVLVGATAIEARWITGPRSRDQASADLRHRAPTPEDDTGHRRAP